MHNEDKFRYLEQAIRLASHRADVGLTTSADEAVEMAKKFEAYVTAPSPSTEPARN